MIDDKAVKITSKNFNTFSKLEIDYSNHLSKGLFAVVVPIGNSLNGNYNLVDGKKLTVEGSGITPEKNRFGANFKFDGNNANRIKLNSGAVGTDLTVIGQQSYDAANRDHALFDVNDQQFVLWADFFSSSLRPAAFAGGSPKYGATDSLAFDSISRTGVTTNIWGAQINWTGSALNAQIWNKGVKDGSVSSIGSSPAFSVSENIAIGNNYSANKPLLGATNFVFVWSRTLSDAEMQSALADPYQILKPATHVINNPVSTASENITGTIAVSFDDTTSTASGTVTGVTRKIRYVNMASPTGGNGTTDSIAAGNPDRAYQGLVEAHAAELAIDNDLTAMKGITFLCEGTTEEVGNLVIAGWVNADAGNSYNVQIQANGSGHHNFTPNSGYTLRSTSGHVILVQTPLTVVGDGTLSWKGIQIVLDSLDTSDEGIRWDMAAAPLQTGYMVGCDIRAIKGPPVAGQDGTYINPDPSDVLAGFDLYVRNCQITGFGRSGVMVQHYTGSSIVQAHIESCSMYDNAIDVSGTNSTVGGTTNIITYNTICASALGFANLDGDATNPVDSWTGSNNITTDTSYNKDAMIGGVQATNGITTVSQVSGAWIVVESLTLHAVNMQLKDSQGGNLPAGFAVGRLAFDGSGTPRTDPFDCGFYELIEAVTGTLNQTIDPTTSNASGNIKNSGTINLTLENTTCSASGSIKNSGTIAQTFEDTNSNSIGVLIVKGDLSAQATNNQSFSDGVVGDNVSGTVLSEAFSVTSTATGNIKNRGFINSTLEDIDSNSTGDVGFIPVTGLINVALNNVISDSDGLLIVKGDLSAEATSNRSFSDGVVGDNVSGTVLSEAFSVTSTATGNIKNRGFINSTLEDIDSNSTGVITISGFVNSTLENHTSNAIGFLPVSGLINLILEDIESTSSGLVGGAIVPSVLFEFEGKYKIFDL